MSSASHSVPVVAGPVQHSQPPLIANPLEPEVETDLPSEVPEDVIDGLKAIAQRQSGTAELREVSVVGIDHPYLLRKPTREEWDAYFDGANEAATGLMATRQLAGKCSE